MLHVGIFYRAEKSFCATNPNNTFSRAAKLRHLVACGDGAVALPCSRLFELVHPWSFTVCVCRPVGVSGRAGALGAQGEVMLWGSHIPEDMEGIFSTQAGLSPGHTIPLTKVLSWLCCPRTGVTLIIRSLSPALSASLFLAGFYVFIFVPMPSFQLQKAVLPLCSRPGVFIQTNDTHCSKTLSPENPEVLVHSLNRTLLFISTWSI